MDGLVEINEQTCRPIGYKVLVKLFPEVDKIGAIILPSELKKRSIRATVMAKGATCEEDFNIGDVVLFDQRADNQYGEYLLINERDIKAIEVQDG